MGAEDSFLVDFKIYMRKCNGILFSIKRREVLTLLPRG